MREEVGGGDEGRDMGGNHPRKVFPSHNPKITVGVGEGVWEGGEVWGRGVGEVRGGACGGGEGGVLDRGGTLCEPPGTLLSPRGSPPPALQPSALGLSQDQP